MILAACFQCVSLTLPKLNRGNYKEMSMLSLSAASFEVLSLDVHNIV